MEDHSSHRLSRQAPSLRTPTGGRTDDRGTGRRRNYNRRLARLRNKFKRDKTVFACRICGVPEQSSTYERHCRETHGFDCYSRCVWCDGRRGWPAGTKHDNVEHMKECWSAFRLAHGRSRRVEQRQQLYRGGDAASSRHPWPATFQQRQLYRGEDAASSRHPWPATFQQQQRQLYPGGDDASSRHPWPAVFQQQQQPLDPRYPSTLSPTPLTFPPPAATHSPLPASRDPGVDPLSRQLLEQPPLHQQRPAYSN